MEALAVVVATKDRPLRLRWLLNALEDQDTDAFSVVVCHNSGGSETDDLLASHPLTRAGRLTWFRRPGGDGPAAMRNHGWRAATDATWIAFTDDDCRPPADWVSNALAAIATLGERSSRAIVQGATHPDPDELFVYHHAPHSRSQQIDPPADAAQTCNILYPRALLSLLGGFDENFPQAVGEDTDLAMRGRAAGAAFVAAPSVLTYHAVDWGLRKRLRSSWRWQHMALVFRKHPSLRRQLALRVFWKPSHLWLLLAAAGLLAPGRRAALLALPYLATTPLPYGRTPRGVARAAAELPGRALIDTVELAACLRGSVRHRSPLL